jgi:uncharacterized protein (DUF342 family)
MTEEERSRLKLEGFTGDQIDEIALGEVAGLDVSKYADKEFFAIQMRQIRQGLEAGLDVSMYADPAYDWFQMEEIRLGLVSGVDVELYNDPAISYDRMREVRKGLEKGVDLSKYVRMDAGYLKQIRKAYAAHVKIVDFIKQGYDPEQVEEIRISLEKGVFVRPYITAEFRGMAIRQVSDGLQSGVDVTIYAKPEYDWRQMEEIRLGLENRLDVSVYTNPLYSWQQMKEIRIGLAAGLDVDYYKSFMYTANEMKKRRRRLEDDELPEKLLARMMREGNHRLEFDHFDIEVGSDEMSASIKIKDANRKFKRSEIMLALQKEDVTNGVDEAAIKDIERGEKTNGESVVIARGQMPKDGEDGWYEYFFRTNVSRTPKVLEDGSVDYQDSEWFEIVKKGQKIAVYHGATEGVNGFTVRNMTLHAKNGREQKLLTGKGFTVEPDGKTYIAAMDGKIVLDGEKLEITRLLVVDDISLASGDVKFDGCLYVTGDVGNGTRIEATEDIVVDGFVQDSNIVCGGNVILRKGMHAGNAGRVNASGSVMGKFFESVKIRAGEDIRADYCMNCNLYSEGQIVIAGANGSLIGGTTFSTRGINVLELGNHAGITTHVKLGVNEKTLAQLKEIEASLNGVKQELKILQNAYSDFVKKYPAEERNAMDVFLKVENAIYTKNREMEQYQDSKKVLEAEVKTMQEARVVVNHTLFEGVTVEINGIRWNSLKLRNINIRSAGSRVAVYANKK